MSRIAQPAGVRGSLKWIQRTVNTRADILDEPILRRLSKAKTVNWVSPLKTDSYAEYRDRDFLEKVGQARLASELGDFWPQRGPQWDALAVSDAGDVLLVEAKAHIDELFSPGTASRKASRERIVAALQQTIAACGAKPKLEWADTFYQLANRFAHLHFLRKAGVPAWLMLVNFTGDDDMKGPHSAAEWEAAYRVVHHVLGVNDRAPLMRNVIHVYPDVRNL